ncbi:GNAT family N-acetyltransferase [Litorihabitans aurantiacus]|uniref:GNAT family N-acetyltransferase n=1 Tax=Litorihabitans aurantiacus TaxID=1930061 RepID=UPI0024E0F97C|nr:GNAT family N-acetyltransferase [Litorihabitans aurantiacus]
MTTTDHPAPDGLELRPLTIPTAIDAPDAGDFAEMVRVRNEVYRLVSGHDDHAITAAELLPYYAPGAHEKRLTWIAVLDGAVVGRLGLDLPHEGGGAVGLVQIELHPEVWGRGIGGAAMALIERTAREHGRTTLQCWAEHHEVTGGGGDRLAPPTGFGSVPADAHNTRFLLAHGFALEQVERASVLDLTDPATTARIEALLADARTHAAEYDVVSWQAPTPPEHVAGYAWLKSRMATDVPAAAMETPEEVWDAARVAEHDTRYTAAGRTLQVVAARHTATGELCAFTELVGNQDRTTATHQEDTLVLREHRGHRLGALVKGEAILRWRGVAPTSPRVMTWNAEENRPMLAINEAMGFVPLVSEGAWQKRLA